MLDRLVSVLGAERRRWPTTWPGTPTTGSCSARRRTRRRGPRRRGASCSSPWAPRRTLAEPVAVLDGQAGYEALRQTYRRRLLTIAARDLTGLAGFEPTAAALAELASATLEAALAIARSELPPGSEPCRLAVIAMGKCGGLELNYVSDVDVLFVAEPVAGRRRARRRWRPRPGSRPG